MMPTLTHSATITEFDRLVDGMLALHIPRPKAEAAARAQLGMTGSGADVPAVDEDALEKVIEAEGDKIMRALGFDVIRFSHPGKTKQTPGIPDRRYYRRPRSPHDGGPWTATNQAAEAIVVWWEAKSATGHQRPEQRVFQELAEACGERYVLGTHEALIAWLIDRKIAQRVGDVLEPLTLHPADTP